MNGAYLLIGLMGGTLYCFIYTFVTIRYFSKEIRKIIKDKEEGNGFSWGVGVVGVVPAGHLEDEEGQGQARGAVERGRRRRESKDAIRKMEVDN